MNEKQSITRLCTACLVEKIHSDFYKQNNGLHGLSSQCKVCIAAKRKSTRLRDPEKTKRLSHERYLRRRRKHHEETRKWREANPDRSKANRRNHYLRNKERHRILEKAYRDANRERLNAIKRQWEKRNPLRAKAKNHARRARKLAVDGKYTAQQIKDLHRRQLAKCACCAVSIATKYHIDHITPLCRGGSNHIRNIQLLCPKCNLLKGGKDPIIFMQERGFLL